VAHAGGFSTARFGGERGHAATDHVSAVYYSPAGLALRPARATRCPGLPVILMPGNADRSESRGTAAAFLQKPFTMAELTAVLRVVAPACVRDA